jgi:hypothetical protein
MDYDDWPDDTMENRRAVVRKTIRRATMEELREIGARQFPIVTDPWCEKYHAFLKQHGDAKFYLAESPEGARIVYCRDSDAGVWFLPDSGMGIIQPKGLQVLAEIVDSL